MDAEKRIHGFSLLGEREVKELGGVMYHMRHARTGLELIWLKREEENKTFGIAFQTVPEDDTGVFHILEHSVLCGSQRYPVKDPFVELMKYSMNTFLNAMTYPDKTVYPVSSRNHKDFFNLIRVYLDAVFRPLIYDRPEIFYQEGWHYEFDQAGQLSYKGVVFNEMKGAYANADQLAVRAVCQALFPDTCYRFESGGDPAHIPELTYGRFLDSHRRCYSPSNAYVFLDGAVDLEETLAILDGEYLSGMAQGSRLDPPQTQPPVDGGSRRVEFELPPEEDASKRYRLVWGRVAGRFDQLEKLCAIRVLADVLCGDNQAPLRRAILSQGLAESVNLWVEDEVSQPWVNLEVRNLAQEDLAQVQEILERELERLAREGLDPQRLEAAIANLEFKTRERDHGYPQGLFLGLSMLNQWMRGGDPAGELEIGERFHRLREKAAQGYFEGLIREVLLDNPHRCEVILCPSAKAGAVRRQEESRRLNQEAAGWGEGEREALGERQRALERFQSAQDTPEALATLPRLALSDLPRDPMELPTQVECLGEAVLLRHEVPAGGIVYCALYFDVEGYTQEELSCLSFLCRLLGRVDTGNHTAEELGNQIRLLCGSLGAAVQVYQRFDRPEEMEIKLRASFSALAQNLGEALKLLEEVLTDSRFEAEREIQAVLRQVRMGMFQTMVMSGSSVALGRVAAQSSASAVVRECIGGYAYYRWLKEQEEHWNWPELKGRLIRLFHQVVCRAGVTVSATGTLGQEQRSSLAALVARLPQQGQAVPRREPIRPWGRVREGIEIPSDVCFAAMGGELRKAGGAYSGAWQVGCRMVGLDYLWNAIRVQGGAYGTGLVVNDGGFVGGYSFRDPDGARSLACYGRTGEFLAQLLQSKPDLTGYIIGAVAEGEPLLTPRGKGAAADELYWRGLDWEQRCRLRRELLDTGLGSLADVAQVLERVMEQAGVCVVGPRAQLEACGLERILPV